MGVELTPGFALEQKVVTVQDNDDANVNGEIDTQALDGWSVAQIAPVGNTMVILFARTSQTVPA